MLKTATQSVRRIYKAQIIPMATGTDWKNCGNRSGLPDGRCLKWRWPFRAALLSRVYKRCFIRFSLRSLAMHAFPRRFAVCLSVCLVSASVASAKQPLKKLKVDPSVPPVGLFDAIEAGTIETTVMAKNAHEAQLMVTNRSDVPVTVQMPKAVVAVQVLKQQLFGQQNRLGQGGPGGNMMGGAQPMGMGMQNNMGNNNNMIGNNAFGQNNFQGNGFNNVGNGLNGNGFFSVPPQKTVQVPMKGVCLAHGKPDPRPRMTYRLVKLEDFTSDAALRETLTVFGTSDVDLQAAQAAVWHLTDRMSWQTLREKRQEQWGAGEPSPYFSEAQVDEAENLIRQVREKIDRAPRRAETAAR
jgi:hypothetical protein